MSVKTIIDRFANRQNRNLDFFYLIFKYFQNSIFIHTFFFNLQFHTIFSIYRTIFR